MHTDTVARTLSLEAGSRCRILVAQSGNSSLEQVPVDLKYDGPGPRVNLFVKRKRKIKGGCLGRSGRFERHTECGGMCLIDDLGIRRSHGKLDDRVVGEKYYPAVDVGFTELERNRYL